MGRRLKWQFGLDVLNMEQAHACLDAVGEMPEIIEIGTPLIFFEGLRAIREVRERCPNQEILVDCKMIDAASLMSVPMYEAGADIVTVEGGSHDYVISEQARVAHEYGKPCEADLMNVKNLEQRAEELMDLGVDIIGMHAASQALRPNELHVNDIKRILSVVPAEKLCIAHSITLDTLDTILDFKPAITVCQIPVINQTVTQEERIEVALKINEIFNKHEAML
ncbi:MAG TPA: orotidine 5'-phosphate decarboxylase [Candidatus Copromorpha excrementigallinarum]|uniref:Orotidine 5'-phosphate decarboxylase n=1 Tax=Candidatus Allocopromorpha excrementigallinarum TaxID=2840742 RepID=A0A9D1I2J0_9FIRM|nr:orotidine 5'-phosphate decarboxylase [Candidatus Copromorpha excrementigallinarum]